MTFDTAWAFDTQPAIFKVPEHTISSHDRILLDLSLKQSYHCVSISNDNIIFYEHILLLYYIMF